MPNTKSVGIAFSDPALSGATIDSTVIGGTTAAAATVTTLTATGATTLAALTATGNVSLGTNASSTFGAYGTTPAAQRSGAAQATSNLSTASSTAIDTATKAAIIEIMNTLATLGLWKGSA